MATPTDQDLLDKARQALADLLDMLAAETDEDGRRAKMLEIGTVEQIIAKYEARVAASSGGTLRPIA